MQTINKTSTLIEKQFPAHLREGSPQLVAFIKAYYEYAELQDNALNQSKSLLANQDVDTAEQKFLDRIHEEVIPNFPKSAVVDEKIFLKHARDFYRAKGSDESIKLLFRLLFNEDIDIYYPGEHMLRASDGRWVIDRSIKVIPKDGSNVDDILGQAIIGMDSGARAKVEKIVLGFDAGLPVHELFLSFIIGAFEENETIKNAAGTIQAEIYNSAGSLAGINITDGGAYHQVGDPLTITTQGNASGTGVKGEVAKTTGTSAVTWAVADGGTGYKVDSTITINHGSGKGTSFEVVSIKDEVEMDLVIDKWEPLGPCRIDTMPTFISEGANTSPIEAPLSLANMNTKLEDAFTLYTETVGTLDVIKTTSYGTGYFPKRPTASVTYDPIASLMYDDGKGGHLGSNAVVNALYAPGTIDEVKINEPGVDYVKLSTLELVNKRHGSTDAYGTPRITGVKEYPGKYIDTKGFLSDSPKLQDNYYYQEFSYDIKSNQLVSDYATTLENTVHPAGIKYFGSIEINTVIGLPPIIIESGDTTTLDHGMLTGISSTIEIDRTEITIFSDWMTTPTTGTADILEPTFVNYGADTLDETGMVYISGFIGNRLIRGNGTSYVTEVPVGTMIKVVDPTETVSERYYTVTNSYSDTLIEINGSYPQELTDTLIFTTGNSITTNP